MWQRGEAEASEDDEHINWKCDFQVLCRNRLRTMHVALWVTKDLEMKGKTKQSTVTKDILPGTSNVVQPLWYCLRCQHPIYNFLDVKA